MTPPNTKKTKDKIFAVFVLSLRAQVTPLTIKPNPFPDIDEKEGST
jgi:hypothetical protein